MQPAQGVESYPAQAKHGPEVIKQGTEKNTNYIV